jgi:hypothetical protein
MNIPEAKKILGVPETSDFEEVRKRFRVLAKQYHPDIPGTGDEKKFILISSAYLLLQGNELGVSKSTVVKDDIGEVINLKNKINAHLDVMLEDYRRFIEQLKKYNKEYIEGNVQSAKNTTQLKEILEGRVAHQLVDMNSRLKDYLKHLEKQIRHDKNSFIFELFRGMYRQRRQYWLYNIWKEPAFYGQVIIVGTFEIAKNIPDLVQAIPAIANLTSIWWIPFIVIFVGMSLLLHKYILLDPGRQFVPPKLSLESISQIISNQVSQIGSTRKENAAAGSIGLGLLGAFVDPTGISMLVGALFGLFGALFGKNLSTMKNEASENVVREINRGFHEIDLCMEEWVRRIKEEIYKTSLESFVKNCSKLSGFLAKDSEAKLLMTTNKK